MTSKVQIAIKQAQALESLGETSERFAEIFGIPSPNLGVTTRWGGDYQNAERLQRLATFFNAIADAVILPPEESELLIPDGNVDEFGMLPDYEAMTVAELEAEAQHLGIYEGIVGTGSSGNIVKADLVAALFNAEKVSDGNADE